MIIWVCSRELTSILVRYIYIYIMRYNILNACTNQNILLSNYVIHILYKTTLIISMVKYQVIKK